MHRIAIVTFNALWLGLCIAVTGANAQELPPFLKPYYAPLLALNGQTLELKEQSEKNNVTHYVYLSSDQAVTLTLDYFPCQSDLCKTVYDNALKYTNEQAGMGRGRFVTATDSEYRAEWTVSAGQNHSFAFRFPSSLQFWTYTIRGTSNASVDAEFDKIGFLANRQRYEEAVAAGNVEMGRWDIKLRDFARQLLKEGSTADALIVLRNVIATSPFDFGAQMDFALNSPDQTAAKNSATAVLDNAENPELIANAAQFLRIARPSVSTLPLVSKSDRGLQVVLVPLGDADVGLLSEAAKIFSTITTLPVKLRRLEDEFHFGVADRLIDQRAIQQTIIQKEGPNVDFTGWDVMRYQAELLRIGAGSDPLGRFLMRAYVNKLAIRPGQYSVDPYLNRLGEALSLLRSSDQKTIYVGVTNENIYSGDVNYLFSLSENWKGAYVGILSYGMMTAEALGEPYESRKRLAERIAKELAPASLKALDIPRPVDPTDPYSYSNGIQRLNEKSLILSKPTKDALDKFR